MQFPQGTSFTPYVVMCNTTSQSMQVQLAANLEQGGSPVDVPLGPVTLAAGASQQVDINSMLSVAGLSGRNGLLNLRASFSGNPGDLLEETGSVDQSFTYVFEVPAHPEAWTQSKIINVWNVAGDTDTMLNFWNYSAKDEDFLLTFYFHGGEYQIPVHLATGASSAMSVASLVKSGAPDAQGRSIPTNTTLGSAKISGMRGDRDRIDVAVNAGVFNVRTGTCFYALIVCAGVCDGYGTPNPLDLEAINDTDEVSAIIVFYDGHTEDVTDDQEFTSGDTSIATVGCTYCGTVQVTAKGVGTTQIEASAYYQGYNGTVHVCPGDCPQVYVDFTVSAPVLPVIDGIETSARLWFFGTGNSESGYNTSTTLTADTESFTDGSYQWTVTTGSSIVQFSNNSSTITVTDATTTALNSKSYSVNANDVTVTLLYTTPDTSLQTTVTLQLDVDSPYQFSSAGANQDYGVAYEQIPVRPNTLPPGRTGT